MEAFDDENMSNYSDESADPDFVPSDFELEEDEDIMDLNATVLHDRTNDSFVEDNEDVIPTCDPGPPTPLPKFNPKERISGLHLPDTITRMDRRKFLTPFSFFKLFFTQELLVAICNFTNNYAADVGPKTKRSYYARWKEVEVEELYKFIGLLMYMGIVKVGDYRLYWSCESLFNGLWARSFMGIWRYKCLMSFLKICDHRREDKTNKFHKAQFLCEYIKRKCRKFFQPYQNISIDERMVKNKGRYSFRQYIKDKPTKWGMKLWVLADSKTGYTYNFDVYLGKKTQSSKFGLAYDVVMKLVSSLCNMGYHLYMDNFYTSYQLLKDLVMVAIRACGTILCNRKGFPKNMKDTKKWEKQAKRGDSRWERDGDVLALQWKDNKTVSFCSTIHTAGKSDVAQRKVKENDQFVKLDVERPILVADYNKFMNGVDRSDQLINKFNIVRKTNRWWMTLFLHMIDIARVNSFILFQLFREENNDIEELRRISRYSQKEFTIELIREIAGLEVKCEVPVGGKIKLSSDHPPMPAVSKKRKNCKLCYMKSKTEQKTRYIYVFNLSELFLPPGGQKLLPLLSQTSRGVVFF